MMPLDAVCLGNTQVGSNTEKQRQEHVKNIPVKIVGGKKSIYLIQMINSLSVDDLGRGCFLIWYDSCISLGYRFLCWSITVAPFLLPSYTHLAS